LARVSATVAEIMDRDPVTVRESDTVETVVRLLHENQVRGLPVVGDGDKVVGIVTENDLLLYDEQEDIDPPPHLEIMGGIIYLGSVKHWEERVRKSIAATVGDLMTRDPVTVAPDASAREAGSLIAAHHHNRLPVVDGEGRLVGVISRVDVLEALLAER
jgi:CBS domain-containing protein